MSERLSIEEFMRGELAGFAVVPKMVPHVKSQWLSDLRINPKYSEQGFGKLKRREPHCKTKYCCLGVLSDRIFERTGQKPERIVSSDGRTIFKFENETGMPTSFVLRYSGVVYNVSQALAFANDYGYSFAEIADWIEENL